MSDELNDSMGSEAAPEAAPAPAPAAAPAAATQQPSAQPGAPATKGGLWKDVLRGALAGLAGSAGAKSFGAGVGYGVAGDMKAKQLAVENQQAAETHQAHIKFVNAQAAAQVAAASANDIKLHELPQQLQDQHNTITAGVVDKYTRLFGNPTIVKNTGTDAQNHLEQLTGTQGSVGHNLIVNDGKNLYAWDTSSASSAPDALDFVQTAGKALGSSTMSGMTADAWKKLPAATKQQYMATADDVYGTTVPDPKNAIGQISRLSSEKATLENAAKTDPKVAPLLEHVTRNLDLVTKAHEQDKADKKELANSAAATRANALNAGRPQQVVDEHGNLRIMRADQAEASGAAPAHEGSVVMSKQAQMQDIHAAIAKGRDAIAGLPDSGLDAGAIQRLTQAMRATDPTVSKQLIDSVAGSQRLSPGERQFAVWMGQLAERAQSLRNIAGMGQGSDQMRNAILATLPAAKDGNKKLMIEKMDAVENMVQNLERGIPKVKATSAPAGKTAPAAAAPASGSDFFSQFGGQARPR